MVWPSNRIFPAATAGAGRAAPVVLLVTATSPSMLAMMMAPFGSEASCGTGSAWPYPIEESEPTKKIASTTGICFKGIMILYVLGSECIHIDRFKVQMQTIILK